MRDLPHLDQVFDVSLSHAKAAGDFRLVENLGAVR
jgi:hypothetical protein